MIRIVMIGAASAALFLFAACGEDGAGERAGRKMDETMERLRHGDEGTLEKAGRKADEAFEEAIEQVDEAIEEADERVRKAAKDLQGK